jgi:hypothetical protein
VIVDDVAEYPDGTYSRSKRKIKCYET